MDNTNAVARLISSIMAAAKAEVHPGVFLGMANTLDALAGGGSTAAPERKGGDGAIPIPFKRGKKAKAAKRNPGVATSWSRLSPKERAARIAKMHAWQKKGRKAKPAKKSGATKPAAATAGTESHG